MIVADPTALGASMAMDAAYAEGEGGRNPMNLSLQMSQASAGDPSLGDPRVSRQGGCR